MRPGLCIRPITIYDEVAEVEKPRIEEISLLTKEPSLEPTLRKVGEGEEVEKPKTEEISAGKERIEEIEVSATFGKEISPKKPRFEEIYNEVFGRKTADNYLVKYDNYYIFGCSGDG